MKTDLRIIVGLVLVAVVIFFYFEDQKREYTLEPIKSLVIAKQRPLIIHFFTRSSRVCKLFEPVLRKALIPYGNTIDCQDLDIDVKENRKLLNNCGASGVPTIVVFDRKGNKIVKETGFLRQDELDNYFRKAVSYH